MPLTRPARLQHPDPPTPIRIDSGLLFKVGKSPLDRLRAARGCSPKVAPAPSDSEYAGSDVLRSGQGQNNTHQPAQLLPTNKAMITPPADIETAPRITRGTIT